MPYESYSPFYDTDKLERVAVNLFYGWGYNFYRLENQLRADDLLVRSQVSTLLGNTRKSVEREQAEYRKKYLPLPTREKPLPDPEAVQRAESLQALAGNIGKIEGAIRALPVPENDRMTQRYRQEAETLVRLREHDTQLVGQAEMMRQLVVGDYDTILANIDTLRGGIEAMRKTLEDRQRILLSFG